MKLDDDNVVYRTEEPLWKDSRFDLTERFGEAYQYKDDNYYDLFSKDNIIGKLNEVFVLSPQEVNEKLV